MQERIFQTYNEDFPNKSGGDNLGKTTERSKITGDPVWAFAF